MTASEHGFPRPERQSVSYKINSEQILIGARLIDVEVTKKKAMADSSHWRSLTSEQRAAYVERYVKTLSPDELAEIEQAVIELDAGLGIPWEQVKAEMDRKHGTKNG